MTRFVIMRHGMNRANQEGRQDKILGTVEAASRESALDVAESKWSCYGNQFFDAFDVKAARTEAVNEAYTQDALEQE